MSSSFGWLNNKNKFLTCTLTEVALVLITLLRSSNFGHLNSSQNFHAFHEQHALRITQRAEMIRNL